MSLWKSDPSPSVVAWKHRLSDQNCLCMGDVFTITRTPALLVQLSGNRGDCWLPRSVSFSHPNSHKIYPLQARSTYDWAKQQNSYLGSTLDSVEQRASGAVQAVHRKYSETYENYYVRPKEAVYENGKWVLENGKNAAIHTGTMALGASVLATQLALQITIGSANLVLDGAGAVVSAGKGVVTSVRQTEHAVEEKIWTAITEAQRMAKVPVDKTAEMTHSFLDIVNALVERTLHVNIQNEPETSVKDRVKNLAQAVVSGLTARVSQLSLS